MKISILEVYKSSLKTVFARLQYYLASFLFQNFYQSYINFLKLLKQFFDKDFNKKKSRNKSKTLKKSSKTSISRDI